MLSDDGTSLAAKARGVLIHSVFTVSGALALVYQVAWIRLFSLELGSTTFAVSTVVAVFMGGLAVGALWGGRLAVRASRHLGLYACIELALAAYALLSPWLFRTALPALGLAASGVNEGIVWLTLVRVLAAALLLLPPTALMGATLPVLTAWLSNREGEGTLRASTLYSWNTFGAMFGATLAGFWLLPALGLTSTVAMAAALNACLALACLFTSLATERNRDAAQDHPSLERSDKCTPAKGIPRTVVVAVALAAVGTMACQIIWTRVVVLVLGGSSQSYSMVLATFLGGIGSGALVATAWLKSRPTHARTLSLLLLVASAVAVFATGYLLSQLPVWSMRLHRTLYLDASVHALLHVQLLLAGVLVLPPTVLFGGIFPAIVRSFGDGLGHVSRGVAVLFAWDVVGSVLGALGAGFILIPILGVMRSLLLAGTALLFAALVIQPGAGKLRGFGGSCLLSLFVLSAWWLMPVWDRDLMTSGPFYYSSEHDGRESSGLVAQSVRKNGEIVYYADGPTATVTVTRHIAGDLEEILAIRTNGKIDGSSTNDMPTQRLLAHLPMLLHGAPSKVAVIGMGTGCTAGSAALHEDSHVTVLEIEPRIVDAARLFLEHNHGVHQLGNVDIVVTDGRLHLLRRRTTYDVIISEPSNAWLAGSSDLFTADFFRRASGSLAEGGVFAQWVHLYGLDTGGFRTLIRGFLHAFPEAVLATTIQTADVLLIGSRSPMVFDLEAIGARMEAPLIAADLADQRVGIHSAYDLLARVRVLPEGLWAMAGEGELHTDDRPILTYSAPIDLFRETHLRNEALVAEHATGIAPRLLEAGVGHTFDQLARAAEAYERYLPGGNEARVARELAPDKDRGQ